MKKYNTWDTVETVLMIAAFIIYAPIKICMDLARLNCKGGKFLIGSSLFFRGLPFV